MSTTDEDSRTGLCARCQHAKIVRSSKGSTFYLCRLSKTDDRFVKYPVLPVRSCSGFKDAEPDPTSEASRITSIDTLRGFALLGILIINIQWMAMIEGAGMNPTIYPAFEGLNRWVWAFGHLFADQKFMTIFSMLFGAGILLMTSRIETRGESPTRLHYRRMVFLILFGIAHAYLIWYGDILFIYALCGMLIYPLRRRSTRSLVMLGLVALTVGSVLSLLFGWSLQFWSPEDLAEFQSEWAPTAERIAADMASYRGGYGDVFLYRAPTAFEFQVFLFFVWGIWRAGGLMLVGMGLFRLGIFGAERSRAFYARLALTGLLVGLPAVGYGVYKNIAASWSLEYSPFFGSQYNYWGSLIVSLGWIGVIMLACKNPRFRHTTRALAAVGRMALTNYLMQSIICTMIFYGYGLGLYGSVERFGQIMIVLAVWTLQLVVSTIWLRHFAFGPAEWLWRSLTYKRRQPLRRVDLDPTG